MKLSLAQWRRLARIGHAASDDPVRVTLTKLHLRRERSTLTAEATDSYIAARASAPVSDWEGETWDALVSARQALLVEKDVRSLDRYRSKKDVPDAQIILRLDATAEWLDVTLADDGTLLGPERVSRRLETASVDSFPQIGDLLNQTRESTGAIASLAASPDLIERLSASSPGADGFALRFSFGADGVSAVGVAPLDPSDNWAGVLMPVRDTA